jgi:hypothetical protein
MLMDDVPSFGFHLFVPKKCFSQVVKSELIACIFCSESELAVLTSRWNPSISILPFVCHVMMLTRAMNSMSSCAISSKEHDWWWRFLQWRVCPIFIILGFCSSSLPSDFYSVCSLYWYPAELDWEVAYGWPESWGNMGKLPAICPDDDGLSSLA